MESDEIWQGESILEKFVNVTKIPEYPIVDPNEPPHKQSSGRRQRFIAAYNTLANAEYAQIKNELDEILEIMTTERNEIEAVLEAKEEKVVMFDGKDHIRMVPKDVYKNLGNSLAEKYDEKTGGKWSVWRSSHIWTNDEIG